MADDFLETRRYQWTADDFIADPDLFDFIRGCWENKKWVVLFGVRPVGAVMATHEAGTLTMWFKAEPPA